MATIDVNNIKWSGFRHLIIVSGQTLTAPDVLMKYFLSYFLIEFASKYNLQAKLVQYLNKVIFFNMARDKALLLVSNENCTTRRDYYVEMDYYYRIYQILRSIETIALFFKSRKYHKKEINV